MDWQSLALMTAGAIGAGVAVVHGVILQTMIVRPLVAVGPQTIPSRAARRLLPALLHCSTFAWFAGGVGLIAATLWLDRVASLALGALVGLLYLVGAGFNFWATRGRHPGWMLMAIAVALILGVASRPGL